MLAGGGLPAMYHLFFTHCKLILWFFIVITFVITGERNGFDVHYG